MAYNTDLEELLDDVTRTWKGVAKKKMFGGVVYMVRGNICVGIWKDQLILRAGEATNVMISNDTRFQPFDVTGRVMKGWAMLAPEGWHDEDLRREAITSARTFCQSLPAKD